jgi:GNAT superfamily N-acetyltransferase
VPQFQRETLANCMAEIQPVLRHEHWEEVGHFKDQPIDMEWDRYAQIESLGKLRCFTIRSPLNEEFKESVLMGYAFYLVDFHLHYKTIKVANQDILYVRKKYRGIGKGFLSWCDEQLKNEGVTTVTQHIKPYFDWGHMAESLGYELAEKIYTRRLD